MLQFSKRLASKGLKITIAALLSVSGFKGFLERFEASGKRGLVDLTKKLENSKYPVKCLVYDANLPWALNIAKQLGVAGAAFFTQPCAAIASYYPMHVELSDTGPYPPVVRFILNQFSNIEQADWVLFNSFDKLEEEVVKWMANLWPVRTIGPTVPLFYLDKRVEDDTDYGFNLYKPKSESCVSWLNTKEPGSVVYVSFGSVASLNAEQMTEIAWALRQTSYNFLWVVKITEDSNLPNNFMEETAGKGLVVTWCP
nr:udp-glycosyltransferase 74e2 [Quercus suber]